MTNTILFYDTETTGLPVWSEPSEGENQPHMVQLAAKLVDADTRKVIQSIDLIIRPDGWVIPAEVTEIHGITTEHALAVGVPEALALQMLLAMWRAAAVRVGHNESFDARIIRIATKRYLTDEDEIEAWKAGAAECTGQITKPIMQMEPRNRWGWKMPKLAEAYKHFIGEDLQNAHSAMADVDGCTAVYFAAKSQPSAA